MECCAVCLCPAAASVSTSTSSSGGLLAAVLAAVLATATDAPESSGSAAPVPACGAVERLSGGATACHRACLDLWTWSDGSSGEMLSPGRGSEWPTPAWGLSVLPCDAGRKALARHVPGGGVSSAAGVMQPPSSGGAMQPLPAVVATRTAQDANSIGLQTAAGAPRPPAGSVSISDAFGDLLG